MIRALAPDKFRSGIHAGERKFPAARDRCCWNNRMEQHRLLSSEWTHPESLGNIFGRHKESLCRKRSQLSLKDEIHDKRRFLSAEQFVFRNSLSGNATEKAPPTFMLQLPWTALQLISTADLEWKYLTIVKEFQEMCQEITRWKQRGSSLPSDVTGNMLIALDWTDCEQLACAHLFLLKTR